jgi:SAM-dependent methyltransferase
MTGKTLDGPGASYRRQAWSEWTDPAIIEAWIRWKDQAAIHHQHLTSKLLERSGIFMGARVLDLASGTGEPALTLSEIVSPSGSVVATEISPEFVSTIQSEAAMRGIGNLTVIQAEASSLPFPSESFDVAVSRLGAMYFVPLNESLAEVKRVLKPSGRASFLTWGMPEQGTYYASCVFPFLMRSRIVPPPPDAPTPLRFSPPGSLASELTAAGFVDVTEERHLVDLPWPGPPEELWEHLYQIASPLRYVFDSLSCDDFAEAYAEAIAALRMWWDGTHTTTTVEVVVGSGAASRRDSRQTGPA